mgnify:CR=1 FL=1
MNRSRESTTPRPSQVELLKRHGLRLDKGLGQHFLVDARIVDRIVSAVVDLEPDHVVEMASGAGALTFALLERGLAVTALELDERMIELLRSETVGASLEIRPTDLADCDFEAVLSDVEGRVVFVGNLPYKVTSPILFGLLPALRDARVGGAVVMVQAEVAQRMAAAPGGRTYGILSVLLQAELGIERVVRVRAGSFVPPPDVESAVVRLVRRDDAVDLDDDGRALVKQLFGQRRKQIGGLLRRGHELDDAAATRVLDRARLDASQRAETLAVADFVRLRDALREEAA